jgi:hypothetical protein
MKTHLRASKKLFSTGALLLFAALLFDGCATVRTTDPARTATEQLLLSTAADHALRSADFTVFANRKVFLDTTYFDSYDSKYAIGTIRDALSRAGAFLEDNVTNTDIIMEARSGALSTDDSTYLLGIPSIGLPIPLAGPLQTPELAFYKSDKQYSTAKIALLAFAKESRAHVYSSGPLDGKSYDNHYKLLFASWISTDIPEKHGRKKAGQYQSWFPQYDLANFPSTNEPPANLRRLNSPSTNAPSTGLPPAGPTITNAPSLTPMNTNMAAM